MNAHQQNERLRCDCGSEQFLAVLTLVRTAGGGTTASPHGYECQQCRAIVDIGHLVKRLQAKHLRAQMAELQEQLGEPAAPSTAPVKWGDKP